MQFNLLSFTLPTETITVNLYSEKVDETRPNIVFRDECPDMWEQNGSPAKPCVYAKTVASLKRKKFMFVMLLK
jgi:hypothetical protein